LQTKSAWGLTSSPGSSGKRWDAVEKARFLLEKTALPLAEIALEVGFVSQSHRCRWQQKLSS
jgi:hypothetical protein